ncbi:carbohydrate binding family 9 domain-containing protein, partial [bacterium]|nr:carbohydrate binding family 9 domain-containing protein [bacterium]
MRRTRILAILFLVLFTNSGAAPNNETSRQLTVPRLARPPLLHNFLQMTARGEVEEQMVKAQGFIQRTPSDGDASTQRTEVYLGYDDNNLYAIFLAFDSEPEKVRARMNRRENVFSDDVVEIMIDTFHDQRRAYAFLTNPLGVQWDAIWTEGQGFDDSFDTLWHSEGRLTEQGYAVRMAIPFKSLRFPSTPEQTWGLIFIREIRRGSFEQSSWPHVSTKIDGRLNQAATLNGLRNISPGRNLQLIPYGTFRSFRLLNSEAPLGPRFQTDRADPDAGLDAKMVVKDNL